MNILKIKFFPLLILVLTLLSACSDDDSEDTPAPAPSAQNQQSTNPSLPSTVSGQVVNMIFTAPQTGAPYVLNQEVTFTFSSSGMMFLDTDPASNNGDEVSISSFTMAGNEFVWADANNDLSYALSLKSDSSINEVNVTKTSTSAFLGQFVVANTGSNTALVSAYQGSYTVATVKNGSHSRMTVSIDSNGNIDFDTNTSFSTSQYARIEDKLDCCDAITIDLDTYPTEPYPRVILYQDSTTNQLQEIDYYPNNNSFVGRVNITF